MDDLYGLRGDGKAELVNGELRLMSPRGDLPSSAAGIIYASLLQHARRTRSGRAYGDDASFVVNLPHRTSFSPDAAFHQGKRTGMKFLEGAPVFAVEVRSEGDHGPHAEAELAAKRADYFAADTLVVWDVDLLGDLVVKVYRAANPDQPTAYRRGERAGAGTRRAGLDHRR